MGPRGIGTPERSGPEQPARLPAMTFIAAFGTQDESVRPDVDVCLEVADLPYQPQ